MEQANLETITTIEKYVGQVLAPSQASMILSMLVDMEFDLDSVLYVLDFTKEVKKSYDFRYAEKVLWTCHNNRCTTLPDVKALLASFELTTFVKQIIHQDRAFTTKEKGFITNWVEMGFDKQCVKFALEKTVDIVSTYSLSYANAILNNWHKSNLKTVEEIKAHEVAQRREDEKIKKSGVIFKDDHHKKRCNEILGRMKSRDVYHAALAYLLALDDNIQGQRISECFDFSEDSIKPSVLDAAWITGTDRRVLQLGFNLWNDAQPANVSDVFGSVSDLEYLLEAVRIRFGAVESKGFSSSSSTCAQNAKKRP